MQTSKPILKLIIGLGNPGKKYQNTYHNAGQLFIDYLKSQGSNVSPKARTTKGGRCQILKSDAYMNNSGNFVRAVIKKNGTKPEQLLIAHDDSDIYLGDYKLSYERGSAGHNGIESIIQSLKTRKFWRLRIGIRPRPNADFSAGTKRAKAGKFVLKKISSRNSKVLESVFEKAAEEIL